MLFLFLPSGSNTHKHGWYGINFVSEISLFALNKLAGMNLIVYTFHLCSIVNRFMCSNVITIRGSITEF